MGDRSKYVYSFGDGKAEGRGHQKALLGGKGAGLAEMTDLGLPVPAGFTLTTEASAEYYRLGKSWPQGLAKQVERGLSALEKSCGRRFGDPSDPLLLSVRSGAAVSMPGMMETILNLGLNHRSVEGLATIAGDRRFALDAYRRLIMMYGSTVAGIDRERFDESFDHVKESRTRTRLSVPSQQRVNDADVSADELATVVESFLSIYQNATGLIFPQDPHEQLHGAINAVFESWMAEKAVTYRRVEKISGLHGTAVNVMQMVFGNLGSDSGTGVCFTRDPSTGENTFYGDLLINAQGEDVVAGIRTPMRIVELQRLMPDVWDQLLAVRSLLELHYLDMQDLEFTIERDKLYMLQCRTGKRSPGAAFRIAKELATEPIIPAMEADRLVAKGYLPRRFAAQVKRPIITKQQAIARIKAADVERLFCPIIDPAVASAELEHKRLGAGIGAVPGAACGVIVLSSGDAERLAAEGKAVLLVRKETSPEDVGGMHAAAGILTATGGKTSHAAVVARGWGKCCIVGCDALRIDESAKTIAMNGRSLREGDVLTLDGSSGAVYEGLLSLIQPQASAEFQELLRWCDEIRRLRVRTNADTPQDAQKAIEFGAEGIGLCRTEHMFFETQDRRLAMQQMIVADTSPTRRAALNKLQPYQKADFMGIFRVMAGKPVTIRLIDPPLHEFLPHDEDDIRTLAEYAGVTADAIRRRTEQLHESNPMLGHRGCRLCITYPEILEMQVSAIMEAAVEVAAEGVPVLPEIMIPLIIDDRELAILVDKVRLVANGVLKKTGAAVAYQVGTMVETPRAALLGDRIAKVAQFISFGTNDLTQTTMGLSRDDAGRFLSAYVDGSQHAIFAHDPFQSLDLDGVGRLVEWGLQGARKTDPKFKVGVCGEHGGDPDSVRFFHRIGMDYVSCSPYRVPVARLVAAQAVIEGRGNGKPTGHQKRSSSSSRSTANRSKRAGEKSSSPKPASRKTVASKNQAKTGPAKRASAKKKVKRAGARIAKKTGRSKPTAASKKPSKKKLAKPSKTRKAKKRAGQ